MHSSNIRRNLHCHLLAKCALLLSLLIFHAHNSAFSLSYYEGKEFETSLKEKRPGELSKELIEALSIPPLAPPPWLIGMQRFGPPPSYPTLRIPGLNAPIPEGYVHQMFTQHNTQSNAVVHNGVSTQVAGESHHLTSTIVLYTAMFSVFYQSPLTHMFVRIIFRLCTADYSLGHGAHRHLSLGGA
jgi:hypothetical protein